MSSFLCLGNGDFDLEPKARGSGLVAQEVHLRIFYPKARTIRMVPVVGAPVSKVF